MLSAASGLYDHVFLQGRVLRLLNPVVGPNRPVLDLSAATPTMPWDHELMMLSVAALQLRLADAMVRKHGLLLLAQKIDFQVLKSSGDRNSF